MSQRGQQNSYPCRRAHRGGIAIVKLWEVAQQSFFRGSNFKVVMDFGCEGSSAAFSSGGSFNGPEEYSTGTATCKSLPVSPRKIDGYWKTIRHRALKCCFLTTAPAVTCVHNFQSPMLNFAGALPRRSPCHPVAESGSLTSWRFHSGVASIGVCG